METERVGNTRMIGGRARVDGAQREGGAIRERIVRAVHQTRTVTRSQLAHIGNGLRMVLLHVGIIGAPAVRNDVRGVLVLRCDGAGARVAVIQRCRGIALRLFLDIGTRVHIGTHGVQGDVQAAALRGGMRIPARNKIAIGAAMVVERAGIPSSTYKIGTERGRDVLVHHAVRAGTPILDKDTAVAARVFEITEGGRRVDKVVIAPSLLGDKHVAGLIKRKHFRGGRISHQSVGGQTLPCGHSLQIFRRYGKRAVLRIGSSLNLAVGNDEAVQRGHLEQFIREHDIVGLEAAHLIHIVGIVIEILVGHAACREEAFAHGAQALVRASAVVQDKAIARAALAAIGVRPAARVASVIRAVRERAGKTQRRRRCLARHVLIGVRHVGTGRLAAHECAREHHRMRGAHVPHQRGLLRPSIGRIAAAPRNEIPLIVLGVGEHAGGIVVPTRNFVLVHLAKPTVARHIERAVGGVHVAVKVSVGIGVDTGVHAIEIENSARQVALLPHGVGDDKVARILIGAQGKNLLGSDVGRLLRRNRGCKAHGIVGHLKTGKIRPRQKSFAQRDLARLEARDDGLVHLLVVLIDASVGVGGRRRVVNLIAYAHAQLGIVHVGAVHARAIHHGVVAQCEAEARRILVVDLVLREHRFNGVGSGGDASLRGTSEGIRRISQRSAARPLSQVGHCVIGAHVAHADGIGTSVVRTIMPIAVIVLVTITAALVVAQGDSMRASRQILLIVVPTACRTSHNCLEGAAVIRDLQIVVVRTIVGRVLEAEYRVLFQIQGEGHVARRVVVPRQMSCGERLARLRPPRLVYRIPRIVDVGIRGARDIGDRREQNVGGTAVFALGSRVRLHLDIGIHLARNSEQRALRVIVGLLGILVAGLRVGNRLPSTVGIHRRELRVGIYHQVVIVVLAMIGRVGLEHAAGGSAHRTTAVLRLHGGAVHQTTRAVAIVAVVATGDLGVVHRAGAAGRHNDDFVVVHILACATTMRIAVVAAILARRVVSVTIARANGTIAGRCTYNQCGNHLGVAVARRLSGIVEPGGIRTEVLHGTVGANHFRGRIADETMGATFNPLAVSGTVDTVEQHRGIVGPRFLLVHVVHVGRIGGVAVEIDEVLIVRHRRAVVYNSRAIAHVRRHVFEFNGDILQVTTQPKRLGKHQVASVIGALRYHLVERFGRRRIVGRILRRLVRRFLRKLRHPFKGNRADRARRCVLGSVGVFGSLKQLRAYENARRVEADRIGQGGTVVVRPTARDVVRAYLRWPHQRLRAVLDGLGFLEVAVVDIVVNRKATDAQTGAIAHRIGGIVRDDGAIAGVVVVGVRHRIGLDIGKMSCTVELPEGVLHTDVAHLDRIASAVARPVFMIAETQRVGALWQGDIVASPARIATRSHVVIRTIDANLQEVVIGLRRSLILKRQVGRTGNRYRGGHIFVD